MAGLSSARRCVRLSHALLLFFAAVLLAGAGRSALVLGEDVAAADAAAAESSGSSQVRVRVFDCRGMQWCSKDSVHAGHRVG